MNHRLFNHSLVFVCLLINGSSLAATIIVDNVTCKLTDAIEAANGDKAVGGCTKGNLADTLTLTAPVFDISAVDNNTDGPNGLPSIKTTIIINGQGAIIQRTDSADGFRLFHVASSGNLTLNRTTVRNGRGLSQSGVFAGQGGGIYNRGEVQLINSSAVRDNSAVRTVSGASRGGGIFNIADSTPKCNLSNHAAFRCGSAKNTVWGVL